MKPIPEQPRPLTLRELRRERLFIATPCYGGVSGTEYNDSICNLLLQLRDLRVPFVMKRPNGEMVARARNRLVADFRSYNTTRILFIDSDVGFEPQLVVQMLRANLYVVGGAYPRKELDWERIRAAAIRGVPAAQLQEHGATYCFNPIPRDAQHSLVPFRGCLPVATIGTGFLMISRAAIRRLERAYPDLQYRDDTPATLNRKTFSLFDYGTEGRRYLSEDWRFCHRWRAIGGRVWAFINAPLTHSGQFIFRGNLARRVMPRTSATNKEK
jgi:hypothetical protein